MKNILLCFYLVFSALPAFTQSDSLTESIDRKMKAARTSMDSIMVENKQINASSDSSMEAYSKSMMKDAIRRDSAGNTHNIERFLYERKEQERRENRNLIIRSGFIGAAVALLVLLNERKKRKAKKAPFDK